MGPRVSLHCTELLSKQMEIALGEIGEIDIGKRQLAAVVSDLHAGADIPGVVDDIGIDQCARMGGAAGIIASVGDDDFGRINVERLRADGADVSAISVSRDYPTGSAFVRYRDDGSRDFVFNIAKSAAAQISLNEASKALIAGAGHLHVMGTAFAIPGAWEITEHAIDVIKARSGSVSFDPNVRKELLAHAETKARFARLVEIADLILPSGQELFVAAGVEGEAEAIKALLSRNASEVALKRGEAGSTFFGKDGSRIDCPAFRVEEIDPTGAGDCFGGAYVACRRLGMPAGKALDYANAAGARNVTVKGPMEGAGTRAELDAFIATTPRRTP